MPGQTTVTVPDMGCYLNDPVKPEPNRHGRAGNSGRSTDSHPLDLPAASVPSSETLVSSGNSCDCIQAPLNGYCILFFLSKRPSPASANHARPICPVACKQALERHTEQRQRKCGVHIRHSFHHHRHCPRPVTTRAPRRHCTDQRRFFRSVDSYARSGSVKQSD